MGETKQDGGPAYPVATGEQLHAIGFAAVEGVADTTERDRLYTAARGAAARGPSLRAVLAGQAMQGLMASRPELSSPNVVATQSVAYADALLRALGLVEGGAS